MEDESEESSSSDESSEESEDQSEELPSLNDDWSSEESEDGSEGDWLVDKISQQILQAFDPEASKTLVPITTTRDGIFL